MDLTTIKSTDNENFSFDLQSLKQPKLKLNYSNNPLALVCAMLRAGKDNVSIHTALEAIGKKEYTFEHVVEQQDVDYAKKIESYFKNSILMRRLNNQHVSKFMTETYDMLSDMSAIPTDCIKILVKLPSLYEESKLTNELIQKYKSADLENKGLLKYDGPIQFAGKIRRVSKGENLHRFYFSTVDNHLILMPVKNSDPSLPLWKFMSTTNRKLMLKSWVTKKVQPGVDFNFLDIGLDYEIFDV